MQVQGLRQHVQRRKLLRLQALPPDGSAEIYLETIIFLRISPSPVTSEPVKAVLGRP